MHGNKTPAHTPIDKYEIAKKGEWGRLIFSRLTKEDILYKSQTTGDTILHRIASGGKLNKVPKNFLTHKYLSQETLSGLTVYHEAAINGCLDQVSPKLLTKYILTKNTDARSVFGTVITQNKLQFFPKDALTEELILAFNDDKKYSSNSSNSSNNNKDTYVHAIARQNQLKLLPKYLLTKKVLCAKDCSNNTIAHYASRSGEINLFDKSLLNQPLLKTTNSYGENVLHWAAYGNALNAIPENLINQEMLEQNGPSGETVFHVAAKNNCLDQIPDKYLTDYNLTQHKSPATKLSPLNWYLSDYKKTENQNKINKAFLKKILKRLTFHSLKEMENIDPSSKSLVKEELLKRKIKRIEENIEL